MLSGYVHLIVIHSISHLAFVCVCVCVSFVFLGLHQSHMEVPRLEVLLEL